MLRLQALSPAQERELGAKGNQSMITGATNVTALICPRTGSSRHFYKAFSSRKIHSTFGQSLGGGILW